MLSKKPNQSNAYFPPMEESERETLFFNSNPKIRVCDAHGSVQRPLKRHLQYKVTTPITHNSTDGNIIVLALASPSFYATQTRIRRVGGRKLVQINDNKNAQSCDFNGGIRLREESGIGIGIGGDMTVARVVSPYFESKRQHQFGNGVITGKKDDEREIVIVKGKRSKRRRAKERRISEAVSWVGEKEHVGNGVIIGNKVGGEDNVMTRGMRKRQRTGKESRCCEAEGGVVEKGGVRAHAKHELIGDTRLTGRMNKESSLTEKLIEHVRKMDTRSGLPLDFQKEVGVCNVIMRDDKKEEREVLTSVMNDGDIRVVSPYFVKEESGYDGLKGDLIVKEKRRRKKKVKNDRLYQERKMDAESQKVVSPYFARRMPNDHAALRTQYMDEVTHKKVKKQRGSKRRTCDEYMEIGKEKVTKKHGRSQKRTHDKQLLQEEKDANMSSILGPQNVGFLHSEVNSAIERELDRDLENVTVSSTSCEPQDVVDCRVPTTEIDVEDKSGKNDINKGSVIDGKHQNPTLCFQNARRKRVPASFLQSKMEKNQGDLTLDGGQEEYDKKKKMKASAVACCSAIKLKGGVLDSCLVKSMKEDCAHDSQGYLQTSAVMKASPYFQKELQKKEPEFTVSSVSSAHPGVANHGVHTIKIGVEDRSCKNDINDDCVIHGEPKKPTPPCPRNKKRKKAKPASLRQSKVGKNQDDLTLDGCLEESNKTSRKTKKKNKDKATSLTNCCPVIGQEGELDSCSLESRKEECTCENQVSLQASTIKKVSPYYQTELQTDEHDGKSDNSDSKFEDKRTSRTVFTEFEDLLLKYAYKCQNVVNKDQPNDSAVKKKRRSTRSTYLTAEEKLAEPYRRKDPHNTWKPPRSPFNLLQEEHAHDPWRILLICMLLNMTTGPQVKQVLSALFSLCPNAEAAVSMDVLEIQRVIQSLGLHRKRAAMIQRFSIEYLSDDWTHVTQLHGIGKYAADAYAIFCNGMWNQVIPNDHMLKYYWKYLKARGLKPM